MNMLQSAKSARETARGGEGGAGAVMHHTTVLPEPAGEGYLEKLKRNNTSVFSSRRGTRYFCWTLAVASSLLQKQEDQ